jgi:hypothetical protein
VLRANQALMAIPLTRAGEQRVTMRYRPRIVELATNVSRATWAGVLLVTLAAAALRLRARRG